MNKKYIYFIIVILLLFSFIRMPIEINNNGLEMALQLLLSAFSPSISEIPLALEAAFYTIIYAGAAISLSILIGLAFSFYASGILTKSVRVMKFFRIVFSSSRAIHELIWALFFVTVFGLRPITAILAIVIPYTGMLGKVFTDIFIQMERESIVKLEQLGASKLQLIFYGYLPSVHKEILSYSLYRFECAIRSSTVLGFVGIAGIGMKIQLMIKDLRFNAMFTYIYVLILLIIIVEAWGNYYRSRNIEKTTAILTVTIAFTSWIFILFFEGALFDNVITLKNFSAAMSFIGKLIGFHSPKIAYLNPLEIIDVLKLTLQTIQMSFVGISIAFLSMMLTVIAGTKKYSHPILYFIVRTLYMVSRAIPELVWAMILVFIFKPGLWVGALALGIHNLGILSKLCADTIESMDPNPLLSLSLNGASKVQLLFYGVIPSIFKRIISYTIYRWEIILRTTIVVGIVGAGGLGSYFKLHFNFFHYTNITLVMIVYLMLVRFADYLSMKLNKTLL